MSKQTVYTNYTKNGNVYSANNGASSTPKLAPGVYELKVDMEGRLFYVEIDTTYDNLLVLPSKEFQLVVNQIETFLKPETKELFKEFGYLYKRSALLYGPPGTGKTCIVNKVAEHVKNNNGIVFFNPKPGALIQALRQIDDIQPETTIMVIFEELDTLVDEYEGALLNILDGEVQKQNIIYIATTNYIDEIPQRIRRPGRFSSVVEVGYPDAVVREYYLNIKLKNSNEVPAWVEATNGLSIDELKETVLAVKCLGATLEDAIARVRDGRHHEEPDQEKPLAFLTRNPTDYSYTKREHGAR